MMWRTSRISAEHAGPPAIERREAADHAERRERDERHVDGGARARPR